MIERRQFPDVPVQVQPVQTFHFQRDVSTQQFGDIRHARDFTESRGRLLVGLRSKTSLVAGVFQSSSQGRPTTGRHISGPVLVTGHLHANRMFTWPQLDSRRSNAVRSVDGRGGAAGMIWASFGRSRRA